MELGVQTFVPPDREFVIYCPEIIPINPQEPIFRSPSDYQPYVIVLDKPRFEMRIKDCEL